MKTILTKKNNFIAKKDLNNKIGLGLSITILAMVVLGLVAIFCDTHTYGHTIDPKTEVYIPVPMFTSLDAGLLGYFCIAINIFVACIAIANIVEFALVRKHKLAQIHPALHVFNLAAAVSLSFNFVFTLLYLLPICCTTNAYCYEYLFTGSHLMFNVATPILAVLLYVFCFKGYSLKNLWWSYLAMIPTVLYFLIYMIIVFANTTGPSTSVEWDLYAFGIQNKYLLILAFFIIVLVASSICIGLWKLNQKGNWNRYIIIAVLNIFLAATVVVFAMALMWRTNLINDYKIEHLTQVQTFFMRFMYFTHLSNWWVGATGVIYAVYAIKIYKGQVKSIPIWAQIARLAGIAAISITLLMQFAVAAGWMFDRTVDWHTALTEGYIKCFRKHLLFEHFIIPFMSIVSFIVLEHTDLKWKHLLHSAAPMAIYVFVYVIVLYSTLHLTPAYEINKRWVCPWDIYGVRGMLGSAGKYFYWVLPPVVYVLMLALNWIFWFCNRKIHFDLPKKGSAIAELKKDWAEFKKWKLNKKKAARR